MPAEPFCDGCPDHEACSTGMPCSVVRGADQPVIPGILYIPESIQFDESDLKLEPIPLITRAPVAQLELPLDVVEDELLEMMFGGWPIMRRRVPARGEN